MDDAVLGVHLESIDNRLGAIEQHLARLNGSVAEHSTRIGQHAIIVENHTSEIRAISNQAKESAKSVSDFLVDITRFDAAREGALSELRNLQETVGEHETYIQRQRGGTQVRILLFSAVGSLVAIAAGVATTVLFMSQYIKGH